ncbi:MAG: hypothetical protein NT022_13115 [Deltaproteobacteria bacterium]|nr:hypothetical protein [Deltaproteobacteria bacterium]
MAENQQIEKKKDGSNRITFWLYLILFTIVFFYLGLNDPSRQSWGFIEKLFAAFVSGLVSAIILTGVIELLSGKKG